MDADQAQRFLDLTMRRLAGAELDPRQRAELDAITRAHQAEQRRPVPPQGAQLN